MASQPTTPGEPNSSLASQAELLNEHQRRRLEVVMATLGDAIEEIAQLAAGSDASFRQREAVLTRYLDDLPDGFGATIAPRLEALRAAVAAQADRWSLPARRISRARAIAALVSSEIVRLEDSYPQELRGYGEVHPQLAGALVPTLDALCSQLAAIAEALRPDQRVSGDAAKSLGDSPSSNRESTT